MRDNLHPPPDSATQHDVAGVPARAHATRWRNGGSARRLPAMTDAPFTLRFPLAEVSRWAEAYDYGDEEPIAIGDRARLRGVLERDELVALAEWKSPRTRPRVARNSATYVEAVTRAAFGATEPRFKVKALSLLDGVAWPTASVLLHFCDRERWPILDFRALWSLRQPDGGPHDFALWQRYTAATRSLAKEAGVSMRTLDRALWAFSKAKQRRR